MLYYYFIITIDLHFNVAGRMQLVSLDRLYYVAAVQETKKQKSKPNVSNINLI